MKKYFECLAVFVFVVFCISSFADEKVMKAAVVPNCNFIYECDSAELEKAPISAKIDELMSKAKNSSSSINSMLGGLDATSFRESAEEFAKMVDLDTKKDVLNIAFFTYLDFSAIAANNFNTDNLEFCVAVNLKKQLNPKNTVDATKAFITKNKLKHVVSDGTSHGFTTMTIKIDSAEEGMPESFAISFMDDGKSLLIASPAQLEAALERYATGKFVQLPADYSDIRGMAKKPCEVRIFLLVTQKDRDFLSARSAEITGNNAMEGNMLQQLSFLRGVAFTIGASADGLALNMGFALPSPENAIQFKAGILDAFAVPMVKMMAGGIIPVPLDCINKLASSLDGKSAKLSTLLSLKDFDAIMQAAAQAANPQ